MPDVYTDRLIDLLGPARRPDEPVDKRARRHRRVGAARVRRGGLSCAARRARARAARHAVPRRRLRDEQRRQRQDPRSTRRSRTSTSSPRPATTAPRSARRCRRGMPSGDRAAGARMEHSYWGTEYDAAAIAAVIRDERRRRAGPLHVARPSTMKPRCARRRRRDIADGQVVGWFQGRMEWGARALGNRSILADPRRARHARHHQSEDQVPRAVPPVRAVGARRSDRRVLRRRRARSVHDPGLSGAARQARRRSPR